MQSSQNGHRETHLTCTVAGDRVTYNPTKIGLQKGSEATAKIIVLVPLMTRLYGLIVEFDGGSHEVAFFFRKPSYHVKISVDVSYNPSLSKAS